MTKLFISHSSQDDAFVRELQQALGLHGVDAWIDSRELLPGGSLDPDIAKAINESSAFAVVVSPASLQSKWVGKELRHALDVQKQRGREKLPVFALSLDDTKLGVLEQFFDGEPLYIPARSGAGGVEAAINPVLGYQRCVQKLSPFHQALLDLARAIPENLARPDGVFFQIPA